MDRQVLERAFILANKGVDLEDEAIKVTPLGDPERIKAARLREYAAEHYSQAVELFLSQKAKGRSAPVIREAVLVLMNRLERIVSARTVAARHPDNITQIAKVAPPDPVKDEKRRKVALEILETEKTYYQGLRNLIDFYMIPFRAQGILSEEDELVVFAGCTQIAGLSEQIINSFSAKLTAWSNDTTTLGDVFLLFAEFLKMYIPFANNFSKGQTILDGVSFLRISETAVSHHVPDIATLRILPIQRLPRYVLLASELLKQTRDGHPDRPLLEKALKAIKDVADHVNARLRASEMEAKVLEIQGNLWAATGGIPELVAPGRTFLKQGPVTKVRSDGSVKRNYYLFAFNDLVVYATTNPLFRSKYHFHKAIDYYGAFPADDEVRQQGIQLRYGECAFKITGSNGYRTFIVSSDAERKDWLQALTDSAGVKEEKRKSWGRARGEAPEDEDEPDSDE